MDFTRTLSEVIDMRSFSNLWYWIVLAVTWSSTGHWVLGVPWDMVQRARRHGGEAQEALEAMARVNIARLGHIASIAGPGLVAIIAAGLSGLAVLGFWYRIEFAQAVFLLAFPLSLVGALSLRLAAVLAVAQPTGEALRRRLGRHRLLVQLLGLFAIFVTAIWGMMVNLGIPVLLR